MNKITTTEAGKLELTGNNCYCPDLFAEGGFWISFRHTERTMENTSSRIKPEKRMISHTVSLHFSRRTKLRITSSRQVMHIIHNIAFFKRNSSF